MRGQYAELEKQLNAHGFARCNTCYIVNLRYCKAVDGFWSTSTARSSKSAVRGRKNL